MTEIDFALHVLGSANKICVRKPHRFSRKLRIAEVRKALSILPLTIRNSSFIIQYIFPRKFQGLFEKWLR